MLRQNGLLDSKMHLIQFDVQNMILWMHPVTWSLMVIVDVVTLLRVTAPSQRLQSTILLVLLTNTRRTLPQLQQWPYLSPLPLL